jgi:hypothetical protein
LEDALASKDDIIKIEDASPSDIAQLGNLLESRSEGTFAISNDWSVLTSSGVDQ